VSTAYSLPLVPDVGRADRPPLSMQSMPLSQSQVRESGICFCLGVGTGGAFTLNYLRERGDKGYSYGEYGYFSPTVYPVMIDRSPQECLKHIRDVLKPTISELAEGIGVSRQAIYDWLSGSSVSAKKAARLAEVAQAADKIAAEDVTSLGWNMRRPLKNGKNFFGLLGEGIPVDEATRLLIHIIRTESQQRKMLERHFTGRRPPSRGLFDEIGVPMRDERG
jgi:transcriptional regulator with XRE-family HTH domain